MTAPPCQLRDLRRLEDCRAVVAIQEAVWGHDGETVPASVLFVSAKRGGILIGADTGAEVVGFVWSMPGVREDGARTHWSHMLGVLPQYRQHRLGERLKWAQREQAVQQGADIIEWTFDPLQAANAHFNLHVLGGVGASYAVNVYGALAGPLHRGTPTDRLIVEWRIREPHVARRLAARESSGLSVTVRSAEVLQATSVLEVREEDGWLRPGGLMSDRGARRFLLPIPPKFSEMQQQATEFALAWRLAVREVMTDAFARGYQPVDFFLNRETGAGSYLLAKS